jgi:hypothetical protein
MAPVTLVWLVCLGQSDLQHLNHSLVGQWKSRPNRSCLLKERLTRQRVSPCVALRRAVVGWFTPRLCGGPGFVTTLIELSFPF